MMRTANTTISAKERILRTASGLFYRQGYHATGINQIIEEAGVSKATFYANFPSKEDLAVAYLQGWHHQQMGLLKDIIKEGGDPRAKLMAVIQSLGPWMESTEFRGCCFLNMTSEVTDCHCALRKEVKYHSEAVRTVLKDLAQDLIRSDEKYKDLDAQQIADRYLLIINGGLAMSAEYHDLWPMELAAKMVEDLLT